MFLQSLYGLESAKSPSGYSTLACTRVSGKHTEAHSCLGGQIVFFRRPAKPAHETDVTVMMMVIVVIMIMLIITWPPQRCGDCTARKKQSKTKGDGDKNVD